MAIEGIFDLEELPGWEDLLGRFFDMEAGFRAGLFRIAPIGR
jgi:hypothetical protein